MKHLIYLVLVFVLPTLLYAQSKEVVKIPITVEISLLQGKPQINFNKAPVTMENLEIKLMAALKAEPEQPVWIKFVSNMSLTEMLDFYRKIKLVGGKHIKWLVFDSVGTVSNSSGTERFIEITFSEKDLGFMDPPPEVVPTESMTQ